MKFNVATGWGYTNPFRVGLPPNDLQRAFLPTISNEQCREDGLNVTETEICTYSHFLQGACGVSFEMRFLYLTESFTWEEYLWFCHLKGDSGGPLAIGDGEEVVGIVSYGTAICAIGRYVLECKSWIQKDSSLSILQAWCLHTRIRIWILDQRKLRRLNAFCKEQIDEKIYLFYFIVNFKGSILIENHEKIV